MVFGACVADGPGAETAIDAVSGDEGVGIAEGVGVGEGVGAAVGVVGATVTAGAGGLPEIT